MTRNCSLFSTTIIGIIIVFYNFNNIDCYDTSLDFNLESLIPDDYNPNVRPLNPYGQNSKHMMIIFLKKLIIFPSN